MVGDDCPTCGLAPIQTPLAGHESAKVKSAPREVGRHEVKALATSVGKQRALMASAAVRGDPDRDGTGSAARRCVCATSWRGLWAPRASYAAAAAAAALEGPGSMVGATMTGRLHAVGLSAPPAR